MCRQGFYMEIKKSDNERSNCGFLVKKEVKYGSVPLAYRNG